MTFNWNYMLSLLSDVDFWQATDRHQIKFADTGFQYCAGVYSGAGQTVAAQAV